MDNVPPYAYNSLKGKKSVKYLTVPTKKIKVIKAENLPYALDATSFAQAHEYLKTIENSFTRNHPEVSDYSFSVEAEYDGLVVCKVYWYEEESDEDFASRVNSFESFNERAKAHNKALNVKQSLPTRISKQLVEYYASGCFEKGSDMSQTTYNAIKLMAQEIKEVRND